MHRRAKVVLVVAVVLLLMVLSGCRPTAGVPPTEAANEVLGSTAVAESEESSEPEASEPTEVPSPDVAAVAEVVTLEYMRGMALVPLPDGKDWIKDAILEDLGIDLQLLAVLDDQYQTALNVRLAAEDIPDIFSVSTQDIAYLADQGVLLDLTPYMDKLSDAVAFGGGEDLLLGGQVDGVQYALTGSPGQSQRYFSYWIREDWLNNLGLEMPTTLEELSDVARAFTFDDPDRNGEDDTIGISGQGFVNAFMPVFGAHGTGRPGDWLLRDGRLESTYFDAMMKDAVGFIGDLIAAGVVDPELVTNVGMTHQDRAFRGEVGIVYLAWSQVWKEDFVTQWQSINPDARWAGLSAPAGPGGASSSCYTVIPSVGLALGAHLADEPEKLEKALELINYLGTHEGSYLVQFGIEGRHYNLDAAGVVVPTELQDAEGGYFYLYQMLGRDDQTYLYSKFLNAIPHIDFAFSEPYTPIYNPLVIPPEGYNPVDANTYALEEIIKFAYGERPLDEWDAFLETLRTTFGYEQMLGVASGIVLG